MTFELKGVLALLGLVTGIVLLAIGRRTAIRVAGMVLVAGSALAGVWWVAALSHVPGP